MSRTVQYTAAAAGDLDAALALIGACVVDPPRLFERCVLDSFDRRLAAHGLLVLVDQAGAGFEFMVRDHDGRELATERGLTDGALAQLRARRVRRRLEKIIGIRAVLPAARWRVTRARAELRGDEGKLIGTIDIEHHEGDDGPVYALCARPTRGYGSELRKALAPLKEMAPLRRLRGELATRLAAQHALREAYDNKPRVVLEATLEAGPALACLLQTYSTIMRANEGGIAEDLDIEFLHDFRVAMRRSRSLLATFRPLLEDAAQLRADYRWLSAASGALRDLDVWLLEPMPDDDALRSYLLHARGAARRRLLRALGCARYAGFCVSSAELIENLREHPAAGQPDIATCATQAIAAHYGKLRRVIKRHRRSMDISTLHELRKGAKKLRYLLEACQSLYAPTTLEKLLVDVRSVQSVAGPICDRHARAGLLKHWLARTHDDDKRALLEHALEHYDDVEHLDLQRRRYRALAATLRTFTSAASATRYARLRAIKSA